MLSKFIKGESFRTYRVSKKQGPLLNQQNDHQRRIDGQHSSEPFRLQVLTLQFTDKNSNWVQQRRDNRNQRNRLNRKNQQQQQQKELIKDEE
uniref:Uncharacterized protein n=1 Tax=Megaselia scalaris TaxID=36166 RepID=T1H0Y1_MEGSC